MLVLVIQSYETGKLLAWLVMLPITHFGAAFQLTVVAIFSFACLAIWVEGGGDM